MEELEQVIGQSLNNVLQTVLEGARTDINKYAQALTTDLMQVMQEQDEEIRTALLEALRGQVEMLAELNRVRANAATWQTVNAVVNTIFTVGLAAIGVPPVSSTEG